MFPGMLRASELVVLAIEHHGKDVGQAPVRLRAGDALLVYGAWSAVDALTGRRDVIVVDSPDLIRRQLPLGPKAIEAAVVLVAMIALLTFDLVPPAVAGLLAAGAMVLTRVMSSEQAYRAVAWETVILVGGLIPLSTAIRQSGAGDDIAEFVIDIVGAEHPLLLMTVMFVLTTVLGLVVSNTATVLIVVPIALAVAEEGGLSAQPMLMLLAIACSGALLTPVQTAANLMVMAPGGYRFGDYWRLGLPILVLWFAVGMIVIPIVWPLTG
jgi:di/tricarboxylate transporter